MKPTKPTKLRGILPLFMLFIVMQSCNVYHSPSYSIDEAIEKEKKIRVIASNLQTYDFDHITKQDDELIGHARTKSKTAKMLPDHIIGTYKDGKMARIKIDRNDVREIKVKNGAASTGAKVGTGLGIAAIVVGAALGILILVSL